MEKQLLEEQVNNYLTTYEIAKINGIGQTTVVYWLKKYNLKTKVKIKEKKVCPRCQNEKNVSEFYQKRGIPGSSSYCKECTNEQTTERTKGFKRLIVEYKGGKCVKCNYNRCLGALEFHHLNPDEKDFNLTAFKSNALSEKIKKELDKCVLLCSNCHREVHAGLININGLIS